MSVGVPAPQGRRMRYGSVCSGIEAASCAWEPLGWVPAWFSEIDPFACAVLAHHWPDVRNYGDFTTIPADAPGIDLLVGGTPCQSFSVAGLRGGLDDDRGNLALEFCRLVDRVRPRWVVWENVPGVLSSSGGRDFGAILGALGELGYGWAYRVLDAQYWGVPQRRRRVFVVGYLGDWRPPCAVLFERTSLSGHPTPRRETGQTTPTVLASGVGTGRTGNVETEADWMIPIHARSENAHGHRLDGDSETFVPIAIQHAMIGRKPEAGPQGPGWRDDGLAFTLDSRTDADAVAYQCQGTNVGEMGTLRQGNDNVTGGVPFVSNATIGLPNRGIATGDVAETVRAGSHGALPMAFNWHRANISAGDVSPTVAVRDSHSPAMQQGMAVRRLTPRECEHLQGFKDDHTLVPYRGKPAAACPDGPRYRSIGNSMAVPVVAWIGRRIQAYEAADDAGAPVPGGDADSRRSECR